MAFRSGASSTAWLAVLVAAIWPVAGSPSTAQRGQVAVSGHVRDETGHPVAGAEVRLRDLLDKWMPVSTTTDRNGAFSANVPATPRLWIIASHADFGLQWTQGVSPDGPAWTGYQRSGPVPDAPVELILRRGVVLRGRVVDAAGRAFARQTLVLIPAYIGSGPATIEASTDSEGRFAFERAVVSQFELVPRSLTHWHPMKPGEYLRFAQAAELWGKTARSGGAIELQIDRYALIAVTIDVTALRTSNVQVWKRWGVDSSAGQALTADGTGRVEILMERGVPHELWVVPGTGRDMTAPWARGVRRLWAGTAAGPLALKVPASAPSPATLGSSPNPSYPKAPGRK